MTNWFSLCIAKVQLFLLDGRHCNSYFPFFFFRIAIASVTVHFCLESMSDLMCVPSGNGKPTGKNAQVVNMGRSDSWNRKNVCISRLGDRYGIMLCAAHFNGFTKELFGTFRGLGKFLKDPTMCIDSIYKEKEQMQVIL